MAEEHYSDRNHLLRSFPLKSKARMASVIGNYTHALVESIQDLYLKFQEEELYEEDAIFIAQRYLDEGVMNFKHALTDEDKKNWIHLAREVFWQMKIVNDENYTFGTKVEACILEGMAKKRTVDEILRDVMMAIEALKVKTQRQVIDKEMKKRLSEALNSPVFMGLFETYLNSYRLFSYVSDQIRFLAVETYENPQQLKADIKAFYLEARSKVFLKFQAAFEYHFFQVAHVLGNQGVAIKKAEDVFSLIFERWAATVSVN